MSSPLLEGFQRESISKPRVSTTTIKFVSSSCYWLTLTSIKLGNHLAINRVNGHHPFSLSGIFGALFRSPQRHGRHEVSARHRRRLLPVERQVPAAGHAAIPIGTIHTFHNRLRPSSRFAGELALHKYLRG